MRKIIIGSRRSELAMAQTNWVKEQLEALGAPFEFEVKEIVTKGDQILDVQLSKIGGKGLFVKEIQQALLTGEIDFAVHSMKDMPAVLPNHLTIGCIPVREDARDVLISNNNQKLADLPKGSIIGTSSLRRSAQILMQRPDLQIKWIRGNINTRMKKLQVGEYDAIILAAAGIHRIGWNHAIITEYLDPFTYIPAIGQGALAIECRKDDDELLEELAKLTCEKTEKEVIAERVFLQEMDGSCQVPIGGYAVQNEQGEVEFTSLIASPDGRIVYKETVTGTDSVAIGKQAADRLTAQGAKKLIDDLLAGELG